jgi:hypothetical protein
MDLPDLPATVNLLRKARLEWNLDKKFTNKVKKENQDVNGILASVRLLKQLC